MQADAYEVSDYKRLKVQMDSGVFSWAYLSAETITDKVQNPSTFSLYSS